MALIEILRKVRVVLNDDGTVRAVLGEYDEKDEASGRIVPKGTKRIVAADLATALPSQATLLAAVDAAHAERDVALAAVGAANSERDAALAAGNAAASPASPSAATALAISSSGTASLTEGHSPAL